MAAAAVPLSSRAARVSKPAVSYLGLFLEASQDMYDVAANPEGSIVLAVAENKLNWPNMAPLFDESAHGFPAELSGYGDMKGTARMKAALAAHMGRKFGGYAFTPEHFAVAAGCGAIIDMLAFCICEAGEAIMIPTPYYPGFDNDLRARAEATIVQCPTEAPGFRVTAAALHKAYNSAAAAGTTVKGILLTNPSNPLGTCMLREELESVLDFANEVGIHVISDEIYAQSVYRKEEETFVSMSTVCKDRGIPLGDNIHLVYGFSKDFSGSGLRAGLVYSENESLQTALSTLTYFCAASNQTHHTLAGVLEKEAALDAYFEKTTAGLRSQYDNLERHLKALGIEFIPSSAGLFTCINLGPYLDEQSWAGEERLHTKIFKKCKVLLTPGKDCYLPSPGWFRCCWAWVNEAAVDEFARRFAQHFPPSAQQVAAAEEERTGPPAKAAAVAGSQ